MPDEQIIDVTKCIHFDKSDIPNGCACYWDGGCNHYCYYKKYTYKHQECEKLYIQLKADEEYHKEEENTLRKIIKNKEERNMELYKENNKLKQTLTEIKEIAGEQIPYLDIDKAKTITEVEYDYADKIYNLEQRMYKILQKISEVENGR